jgi:Coenzyme PQQ synthesis protein D (PqqD)
MHAALNEQIILTEFEDGEGVLIDVRKKKYYRLNETALVIWRGLAQTLTPANIIAQLTAQYEVTTEEAQTHFANLLQNFQVRGLLSK